MIPIASLPGLVVGYLAVGCLVALLLQPHLEDRSTVGEYLLLVGGWGLLAGVVLLIGFLAAIAAFGLLTLKLVVLAGRALSGTRRAA